MPTSRIVTEETIFDALEIPCTNVNSLHSSQELALFDHIPDVAEPTEEEKMNPHLVMGEMDRGFNGEMDEAADDEQTDEERELR